MSGILDAISKLMRGESAQLDEATDEEVRMAIEEWES